MMNTLPIAVPIAVLLAGAAAHGQPIVPLEQDRAVGVFVIVPQCGSDDSDGREAPGFDVFDESVQVGLTCEDGLATAFSSQHSTIDTAVLAGVGEATSEASAERHNVIHAIADTSYRVTFRVDEALPFALDGVLRASSTAEVVLAGAQVRLLGPDYEVILDRSVEFILDPKFGFQGEKHAFLVDKVGLSQTEYLECLNRASNGGLVKSALWNS